MADISDYTGLITTEHSDKPKFMAMTEAVVQPMVDALNASQGLPADFDLDLAIGAQLDVVGLWVGISRNVNAPLSGVYFSLDVVGLGFDQGAWKGPFDPDTGIISLDDETYRTLIRAKIGANRWDGTLGQSKQILDLIFSGDTHVFIEDRQDMSILLGISGEIPSAVFLALLTGGYIPIKPEGVRMTVYVVTSVSGSPIFGFDMSNEYVAGFDVGAWGGNPDNVVYPQPLAFDFTSGPLDSLISFTRPGPGTRYNAAGIMESVAANQPRFDYDPATMQPLGLLLEDARTNLCINSEVIGAGTGTSVSANSAVAPDGATTADLLFETAVNSEHYGTDFTLTPAVGQLYVWSVFVRQAVGTRNLHLRIAGGNVASVNFNFASQAMITTGGQFVAASFQQLPGGWFRVSLVWSAAAAASTVCRVQIANGVATSYLGDGTSGFYVWGRQLELGDQPSSYIATGASAATRPADSALVPISTWFNNLEGTLQAKYQDRNPAQAHRVASLFSSAGQMITIDSNGQCEVDGTFISPPAAGGNAAVAFQAGDAAAAVSGAITATGAPPSLPNFPKGLYLGSLDGQVQFLNGWLKQLTYQPTRLNNSDLIALTT
ncbi:DUF2612 domain-containing protein [Pseudomonas nitroreducens]|uniref:DUF2612 domain-containing protein n=1 Tax=Pseudomonas nitroreducens TaxID=46680 RepID=UPI0028B10CAB|nr:DUF2612 domain-containing protein [Pseudomonas nitroreducens]